MSSEQIRIAELESLVKDATGRGLAPVESWNPPYCGDIGLAIRRDGTWEYRGSPILRMGLVKLFASVLRRDQDGQHYLVTPAEKVAVQVEDAPFLAVEMEIQGEGVGQDIVVRTNLDDIVRCGPAHPIRFDENVPSLGLKPYVTVRGRLEALFTRSQSYDLLERCADTWCDGQNGLWTGGQFFPVPEIAPIV